MLGIGRYLPVVIYAKGAPDKAGYVRHHLEAHQRELAWPWVSELRA
jgi:hypothetical protein